MKPHYVTEKNVEKNTLVVAEGSDNPALYRREVKLVDVNLIAGDHLPFAIRHTPVFARVRYRQPLARATLTFADFTQTDAEKFPRESAPIPHTSAMLVFEHAQKFVAPGQSAVFYSKAGEVLGGGIIL